MAVRFTSLRYFQLPLLSLIGLFVVFAAPTCVKVDSQESDAILSSPEFAQCMQDCNSMAQEARAIEKDIHRDNIQACNDPRCKQGENLRHKLALPADPDRPEGLPQRVPAQPGWWRGRPIGCSARARGECTAWSHQRPQRPLWPIADMSIRDAQGAMLGPKYAETPM